MWGINSYMLITLYQFLYVNNTVSTRNSGLRETFLNEFVVSFKMVKRTEHSDVLHISFHFRFISLIMNVREKIEKKSASSWHHKGNTSFMIVTCKL